MKTSDLIFAFKIQLKWECHKNKSISPYCKTFTETLFTKSLVISAVWENIPCHQHPSQGQETHMLLPGRGLLTRVKSCTNRGLFDFPSLLFRALHSSPAAKTSTYNLSVMPNSSFFLLHKKWLSSNHILKSFKTNKRKERVSLDTWYLQLMVFSGDSSTTPTSDPGSEHLWVKPKF